jgi:hypothetical protein
VLRGVSERNPAHLALNASDVRAGAGSRRGRHEHPATHYPAATTAAVTRPAESWITGVMHEETALCPFTFQTSESILGNRQVAQ